ncbi:hypothetical protein ZOSMA_3G00800 [Zostera marina]|uniref:Uncharacterized protein n=1 Tax=Zostera marina TaxID=29655 RepID=A0A0K9P3Q4_ZOSMR|nr:hypothetical protein ZOSMA_3G00800 [Zostera marina]
MSITLPYIPIPNLLIFPQITFASTPFTPSAFFVIALGQNLFRRTASSCSVDAALRTITLIIGRTSGLRMFPKAFS